MPMTQWKTLILASIMTPFTLQRLFFVCPPLTRRGRATPRSGTSNRPSTDSNAMTLKCSDLTGAHDR